MFITKFIAKGYKRFYLNEINYFEYTPESRMQLIVGRNGSGKAQPLYSKIKTPTGWVTMGDIKMGDVVSTPDGKAAPVIGIFPQQGLRPVYEIELADGRKTHADIDHIWKVNKTYKGNDNKLKDGWCEMTTNDIIEYYNKRSIPRLRLPLLDSDCDVDVNYNLSPYLLGVLIGDGCFSKSSITKKDTGGFWDKVRASLPTHLELRDTCYDITKSVVIKKNASGPSLKQMLVNLDLEICRSEHKHIPEIYMHGSYRQRLELIQGLLDTDGTIGKGINNHSIGAVSFSTSSKKLAEQMVYLIRSIGGAAFYSIKKPFFMYNGERKLGLLSYNVNVRYRDSRKLFNIKHKLERAGINQYSQKPMLAITKVTYVGMHSTQCIMVDHPDHLYITDDFIVTHNTSLLSAMINQPANKIDYDKGGLNEFHFTHKGFEYILVNDFTQGAKYSFKRRQINSDNDYEELNPSRLVSTQKELYFQYTGIDDEIAGMLVGETLFTGMGVSKRREWFNRMHTADTSFINRVYQTLRTQHRNAAGVLTDLGETYTIEKSQLPSEEDVSKLTLEKTTLEKRSHELAIDYQANLENDRSDIELERIKDALTSLYKQGDKHHSNDNLKYYGFKFDLNKLTSEMNDAQTKITECRTSLKHTLNELDELRVELSYLSKLLPVEELEEKIKQTSDRIANCEAVIVHGDYHYNSLLNIQLDEINDIKDKLISLISQSDQDDDIDIQLISKEEYHVKLEKLDNYVNQINQLTFSLNELGNKIHHYEEHEKNEKNNIVCPSCQLTFNPFIEAIDINTFKKTFSDNQAKLDSLNNEKKNLSELISIMDSRRNKMNQIKRFCYENDIEELAPSIIKLNMTKQMGVINHYFYQLYHHRLKGELIKELKILNDSLFLAKDKDATESTKLTNREALLLNSINDIQNELKLNEERFRCLKSAIDSYTTLKEIEKEINLHLSQIDHLMLQSYRVNKNQMIKSLWDACNLRLANVTRQLNSIDSRKQVIASYETTLESTKEKKLKLDTLLDILNPKDGLIAEQSTTFINHFIKQLNGVIKRVFNYDLVVEPCDLEEGDLTYRFKVTGADQIRPDISNTSDGQKDIINFAFKLVAYKHLHLDSIPFINDELGRAFDEYHKQVSVDYLRELMINDVFEQFFLISHHAASYTTLFDSEVVVLDPTNIVLPDIYNTQVTMG